MSTNERQYVVNERGRQVGVLLKLREYRRLLEAAEEIEAIRAYDEAKASGDDSLPLEEALAEIERREA